MSPLPEPVLSLSYTQPVAVVGDIHGRADLLRDLLAQLPPDLPVLVLGDRCDRGPDTRGVLDQLVARKAQGVRGNHDEWLIRWASGDGFDDMALHPMMAGRATLASYGVEGTKGREVEEQRWRVPEEHLEFLTRLAVAMDLTVMGTRYWLVHAGVHSSDEVPDLRDEQVVPHLAHTAPASLLWAMVDPRTMRRLDRTVIIGHSPQREPVDTGNVIAVDTGCGTTAWGRLTAVILPERRFVIVG